MPDPLPPDHAARRRPTPYPEPRRGQVWASPGGTRYRVRRVLRRTASSTPDRVVLARAGDEPSPTLELSGATMLSTWTKVEDDRGEPDA